MDRTKIANIWQLAFLVGLLAVFAAATFTVGMSKIATAFGLAATVAGIINSLLSPDSSLETHDNVLIRLAKRALNVGGFLKTVTVLEWLAFATLCITTALFRPAAVEGVVRTAEGNPVDALVTIKLASGERSTIAKNGSFAFANVISWSLHSVHAMVIANWKGNEVRADVLLKPSTTIILSFPARDLPLRVTHFDLHFRDMRSIVKGRSVAGLEKATGGQFFIVPSDPFILAKEIVSNDIYHPVEAPDRSVRASLKKEGKNLPGWYLLARKSGPLFWRPFHKVEIASMFHGDSGRKYLDRLPNDFGGWILTGNCGDDDISLDLYFKIPEPKLRVVIFENTTPSSVSVGSFGAKISKSTWFRPEPEEAMILEKQAVEEHNWFPLGILRPGESILIPEGIAFDYGDRQEDDWRELSGPLKDDAVERSSLLKLVASESEKEYPDLAGGLSFVIDRAHLINALKLPTREMEVSSYWLGPAVDIKELVVNETMYQVRRSNRNIYVMREGASGRLPRTSCPYAYTYDRRSGSWTKEGHILYGLQGKEKESQQELRLTSFDGKLSLREEEVETSFIDVAYVRQELPGGGERILVPHNDALRFKDGRYLVLNTGDRKDIEFEHFDPTPGAFYTLVATGYYLPTEVRRGGDR